MTQQSSESSSEPHPPGGKSNPKQPRAEETHTSPTLKTTATAASVTRLPRTIGRYRIIRKLGEGGMGIVYEAEQDSPRRAVALKVVRGGEFIDEHHVKLFQREAQALARLKHPGIGAIYEAGRTDDGQHFSAMELVRGRSLTDYLRQA